MHVVDATLPLIRRATSGYVSDARCSEQLKWQMISREAAAVMGISEIRRSDWNGAFELTAQSKFEWRLHG